MPSKKNSGKGKSLPPLSGGKTNAQAIAQKLLLPSVKTPGKAAKKPLGGIVKPRTSLARKAQFQGKYQVAGGSGGGFKRDSSLFTDPPPSLALLEPLLKKRKHDFLAGARGEYKRKSMADRITTDMLHRAQKLPKKQQTLESQRMLNSKKGLALQPLGVERNHINANGQVATQITAFASAALAAPDAVAKKKVFTGYSAFAEAHGVVDAKALRKALKRELDDIESQPTNQKKQRLAVKMLVDHTTQIADQSENLRFGRSQHDPSPDLKITLPKNYDVDSNQDVGSHWDGNRTNSGALTPRSQEIYDVIHASEKDGHFPKGMASSVTTRPIRKSNKKPIGSLRQLP